MHSKYRGLSLVRLIGLLGVLIGQVAQAQDHAPATATAESTDPALLGWMVGAPPSSDKLIRFADGSYYTFPRLRWTFANMRHFLPTAGISRGEGSPSALPRAERADIDAIRFSPLGGGAAMTWRDSLGANYTDAIVVLHRGRVVYERYFGVMKPTGQHILQSVTKSFVGTLAQMLVAEGRLDENERVSTYVPELKDSGFGDATVRQLLDMRTGLRYSEDYSDPKAEVWNYARAGGLLPRPPNDVGPQTLYDFLRTVKKEGEHGGAFKYRTVNAEALGWVVRRVSGQSLDQLISDRIWSRIGAEQDAYVSVDSAGTGYAGGGLNAGLRDLARFGEMMRNDGSANGRQVVPKAVVDDIRTGGDRSAFQAADFPTLPGWSYRDMWWVSNDAHGVYAARGIHGQSLYIDPTAEMVIARFGSFPRAPNGANDPTTLPAYRALADHLIATAAPR